MTHLTLDTPQKTATATITLDPSLPPGRYIATLVVESERGSSQPARLTIAIAEPDSAKKLADQPVKKSVTLTLKGKPKKPVEPVAPPAVKTADANKKKKKEPPSPAKKGVTVRKKKVVKKPSKPAP